MRKQIVSCAVFLLAMSPAIVFAAPPQIRRGFWLSFGLGYGSARVAGIGYDIRIRTNLSITPDFTYSRGTPGDLRRKGEAPVVTGWKHDILAFGVGVTFH
jgi:hypothetical protein